MVRLRRIVLVRSHENRGIEKREVAILGVEQDGMGEMASLAYSTVVNLGPY